MCFTAAPQKGRKLGKPCAGAGPRPLDVIPFAPPFWSPGASKPAHSWDTERRIWIFRTINNDRVHVWFLLRRRLTGAEFTYFTRARNFGVTAAGANYPRAPPPARRWKSAFPPHA